MWDFFSDLSAYAALFLGAWIPLALSGALMGADEAAARLFPEAKEQLEKLLPQARRRKLELAFLVAAVFFSGFSAWSDEHGKWVAADKAQIVAEAKVAADAPLIQRLQTDIAVAQDSIRQFNNTDAGKQQQIIIALQSKIDSLEKNEIERNRQRSLSSNQTNEILKMMKTAVPKFENIQVYSLNDPEANEYAREFMFIFHQGNFSVNGVKSSDPNAFGSPIPAIFYRSDMHGIFICGKAGNVIPPAGINLAGILGSAGILTTPTAWDGINATDVCLIIGPK